MAASTKKATASSSKILLNYIANEDTEDWDHDDHKEDSDDDDADGANPSAFKLSKALLDREKEYIRLNKQLQSKTAQVVKQVEAVVKEGKQTLEKPLISSENVAKAAENGKGPSAEDAKSRKLRGRAPSLDRTSTTKPTTQPQKQKSIGSLVRRPSKTRLTKASSKPSFDDRDFAAGEDMDSLPVPVIGRPGSNEDEIGSEASNRLLKARLHVLQQDLEKMIKEREIKNSTVSLLEEKVKMLDEAKTTMSKSFQALQSQLEKSKKHNDELKRRNEALEAEVTSLRK
ncbi:Golgin sub A member 2, partial [Quaeritorhiza haematococci]